jgi:hypothetical protein
MGNDIEKDDLAAQETRDRFDQTLSRHIERLVSTRFGVGGLLLDLVTVSLLILLAERENEIESFSSDPVERFTQETLLKELSELGLDSDENLKDTLQEMVEKGYIVVDDDGRFSAEKPTTSMAQILDLVFPEMPGMNLVAYFAQAMDEVKSRRKELRWAIRQFDQTLQMRGVPLKKEKRSKAPAWKKTTPLKTASTAKTRRFMPLKKKQMGFDNSSRQQAETPPEDSPVSPSKPRVLSSDGVSGQGEIRVIEIEELLAEQEESPEKDEAIEAQEPEISEGTEDKAPQEEGKTAEFTPSPEMVDSYADSGVSPEDLSDISSEPVSETEDSAERQVSEETPLEEMPSPPEESFTPEEHPPDGPDEAIDERISTFEEDLAMQCPICKTAKVLKEATALGKFYYKCSNKDCNLISWGKPYHQVCPLCNNPFLIESSNRDGKTILKCPRATCRHWQHLTGETTESTQQPESSLVQEAPKSPAISSKPRRRVRKRRVVRRKR